MPTSTLGAERPKPGSVQWMHQEEDRIEEEQERQLDESLDKMWWDNETSTRKPWWETT